MLTTEQPRNSKAATKTAVFELRMHGGTEMERLIPIPLGKHSLGSGPRCSLRLQVAGIQPMECLIVHDATGLRVRRWSENSQINGQPFDEAQLSPGDTLSLGPVALEVVASQTQSTGTDEFESDFAAELWRPDFDAAGSTVVSEAAETSWPADNGQMIARKSSFSSTRRRNRRVQEFLRHQRQEHAELVSRIDELRRSVELAISESAIAGAQPVELPSAPIADSKPYIAEDQQAQELEGELARVREQLNARDQEFSQARFSIDVLERQLIDSQHTMHAFAEERLTWEQQFNELESRLAEYVKRIQDLERQLEQVCEARNEIAASAAAIASQSAVESAPVASETAEPVEPDFAGDSQDIQELAVEPSSHQPTEAGESREFQEPASAEAIDVVAEASESASEPTVEVTDEANHEEGLASPDHASGVSIWREEPEDTADEGNSSTEAGFSEPASFIDRYSHLFSADAESAPPPAEPAPVRPTVRIAPPEEAHSEEESVEQYMAKLLERMRGPSSEQASESETVAPATELPSYEGPPVARDEQDAQAKPVPISDLAELRTTVSAPELASDRRAMRELANQSARHAIGVHTARRLRRSALSGIIKVTLGGAIGAYLLFIAPSWQSLQFFAGCVASLAAIYWGKLALGTLIQGFRLGAFDDFDDYEDQAEAEKPPLPIDVEPTADEQSPDACHTEPHPAHCES